MKHGFWDQDAYQDSLIHHLDARVKIVGFIGAIVVCVSTPPWAYRSFALYALALVILIALSRLPVKHILKRALIVVPFALMVAAFAPFLHPGQASGGYSLGLTNSAAAASAGMVVWNVTVKALLSVVMVILLTSTTPFPHLLHGLRRLKVPDILVMLLSFAYRYLFVLIDEFQRVRRAQDARGYRGRWLWQTKALGHLIGSMFVRTYERAERIYAAMISRGYEGRFPHLPSAPLALRDGVFMAGFLGLALFARVAFA